MTAPAPISPDARALVIESLRAGCDLATATRAARVPLPAWEAAIAESPELAAEATAAITAAREDAAAARAEIERAAAWERAKQASAEREREEAERRAAAAITKPRARAATGKAAITSADTPAHDPERAARIRSEAAALAPGGFGRFLWIDWKAVEAGFPPTSAWWRASLNGFYGSGKRWGYWMVGRGGSKSTTLIRVASADALLTPRIIPTGERWELPIVSVGPEDANRRIRSAEALYQRALGLVDTKAALSPRAHIDTEDLDGNDIRVASVAGTVGNLSGLNLIGLLFDEAAKLLDAAKNANPLSEIIASCTSAFRGRPDMRAIVCSSAWEDTGAHYDAIKHGDTETNYIARLGAEFLPAALEGLEAVAQWEEAGDTAHLRAPDHEAARIIRAHARSLTADSPAIPTWIANEMYGATPALAAIATRIEVQALPPKMLGSLPRAAVWLREIASVPMPAGDSGADHSDQCALAAAMSERLTAHLRGAPRHARPGQSAPHPYAAPGDARYAGPPPRQHRARTTWRDRRVM